MTLELEDSVPTRQDMRHALDSLKQRCKSAKLTYEDESEFDGEEVDINIVISIPSGRKSRKIYLGTFDDVDELAAVEFEKCAILGGYAAISSYKDGWIEAILTAQPKSIFLRNRTRRVLGLHTPSNKDAPLELELKSPITEGLEVRIRNTSSLAKLTTQTSEQLSLSLFIQTSALGGHDEALAMLSKISNALLFEIDLQKKLHLSLMRFEVGRGRNQPANNTQSVMYPRNAYDEAPMALYWYARSATNMPLLQFLAYYQVIEFYFPQFFNSAIARRIRLMLKSPSFRVESDSDLSRVISTVRANSPGFGSERDQLKATLRECLDNKDVQDFLLELPERAEFFTSKVKGITSNTLNPENRSVEMHAQVANRIYDIRCKIVHTKGDEDQNDIELLLPYSPESEKLDNDIELVRYVAQKVLICASRTFDI